jgi:hypothetical protein
VNPRIQANNAAKAAIQPYYIPVQSFGYNVQAVKRNNPDYTLDSFNNPSFDSLATANDANLGTKFSGFKPGMYLIGGMINSSGVQTAGEYMYCRVVGSGTTTDPRRIACGTPSEPLKFDTKGLDLGYDGTSFIGTMHGGTTGSLNGGTMTGPSAMTQKTTLCRGVGGGELACVGLDGSNRAVLADQYDSIRMIRPNTTGL